MGKRVMNKRGRAPRKGYEYKEAQDHRSKGKCVLEAHGPVLVPWPAQKADGGSGDSTLWEQGWAGHLTRLWWCAAAFAGLVCWACVGGMCHRL